MAAKIEVKLNRQGVMAALQAPGVQADLVRRGNAAARAAEANGGGRYLVTARVGKFRNRVSVITVDYTARRAEAADRALTRALDAARRG